MPAPRIKPLKGQQEASPEEIQEVRDHLGQAIYERACELIRTRETLLVALGLNPDENLQGSEVNKLRLTTEQLAELIIADDAESIGRLLINQVINVCWAMAEDDLGLKVSENPAEPPCTVDGIAH